MIERANGELVWNGKESGCSYSWRSPFSSSPAEEAAGEAPRDRARRRLAKVVTLHHKAAIAGTAIYIEVLSGAASLMRNEQEVA